MSSNHSPGPWRRDHASESFEDGTPQDWSVYDRDGETVCEIETEGERAQADADLIAASSELLEAVREALHLHGVSTAPGQTAFYADELGWIDRAKAALAKAEGRQA